MKILKTMRVMFFCGACTCSADDTPINCIFDRKYSTWKSWISDHSYASTYTACKEYRDIIELGIPAVHLMFDKIENNEDDFHLSTAIRRITKRRFNENEWPAGKLGDSIIAARMYVRWWRVDRFQTDKKFRELYDKWKSLRDERNDNASDAYRQIVNLGIPVLPCLVEIVGDHPEFIAAVSELTDGALPVIATANECAEWWSRNKSRFVLPSPDGITHAGDRLIPMMRACVGSSENMFRCEISNATDRVLHIERPFETGNTFVLKKLDLPSKDKIIPLGCNRRWRGGKPSAAYFVELQPHAQRVFTFRREKWPEECVGWHKIAWKLENRFLRESWGPATNVLTVCTGKAELPLALYENEAWNGGTLFVEFGDDSCDDALILIDKCGDCNTSIAGEGGDTLGHLVFIVSSPAREISLAVSKIQNTTIVGDCGLPQKRFQWADIVRALGNCDGVLMGATVDVQWLCGRRKSNVLPLWIEGAAESRSQSNSRSIPLKTLTDDTLK